MRKGQDFIFAILVVIAGTFLSTSPDIALVSPPYAGTVIASGSEAIQLMFIITKMKVRQRAQTLKHPIGRIACLCRW